MMAELEAAIDDALAAGAGVDRHGDWGFGYGRRPPVNPSDGAINKFKRRLVAFLAEIPEDASVRDLLEVLR